MRLGYSVESFTAPLFMGIMGRPPRGPWPRSWRRLEWAFGAGAALGGWASRTFRSAWL